MSEGGSAGDSVRRVEGADRAVDATAGLALAHARIERLQATLERERRALRRSEERFRAVQDASSDPFVVYRALRDAVGEIVDLELVYANPAARGARDAEIGARISEMHAVPDLVRRRESFFRVLGTGSAERLELESRSDGEPGTYEAHAVRIGADLLGVTVQQVGERRSTDESRRTLLSRERRARAEAEAALQSSQTTLALLDAVLDSSPLGVAFLDRDLRYIRVNRTLAQANGAPPAAHVGRTIREMAPRLAPSLEPMIQRALEEGGRVAPLEDYDREGRERHWLASIFPVPAPDGTTLGVGIHTTEITALVAAQRRAERLALELSRSEAQLRFALEVAHLGDWELDVRTGMARTSSGFDRVFGREPGSVRWTYGLFLDHVRSEERASVDEALRRALRNGGEVEAEIRIWSADGAERCVWIRGGVHDRVDGAPARIRGLVQDVSAKREAAIEREAILAREREARREAELANRLKDEFLAIVSHELRTPLHAISGWVSLAKQAGYELAPVRKAFEVIERNAAAQARIIDDLLDASRIIAGKLTLELTSVDVAALARDALEGIRPAAAAKGISLVEAIDLERPEIVGDAERVRQVVTNLLSNAIKFTPRGGRITLAATGTLESVMVRVEDTGAGIAAEFLPYVFDRFRQAESATTRRQGGLGLGLSIVKQIVELHGGTTRATSDGEGRGSQFEIVLARRPPIATPPPIHRAPIAAAAGWLLRSYRIVVVDDERDARELAGFVLTGAGAEVITASSVAEALIAVRDSRPHAIVTDVGMPGEDGYALARRLRAQGVLVPMLALSAHAAPSDVRRAREAGFDAHLAKPLHPSRLVGALASLLGERALP